MALRHESHGPASHSPLSRSPELDDAHDELHADAETHDPLPLGESMRLTDSQKEILAMLEGQPPVRDPLSTEAYSGRHFGVDVAFASLGAVSILAGIILLFFFAAFGSILLVLGAILCAVAFEHVALADLAAEELAFEDPAATLASQTKPAA